MDMVRGNNHAEDFDLNLDPHCVDVDDVASPTIIKLNDAKRHASLLSKFIVSHVMITIVKALIFTLGFPRSF